MENILNNRVKCDVCNRFYSKRYIVKHSQTLQHFENQHENDVEEEVEQELEDFFG